MPTETKPLFSPDLCVLSRLNDVVAELLSNNGANDRSSLAHGGVRSRCPMMTTVRTIVPCSTSVLTQTTMMEKYGPLPPQWVHDRLSLENQEVAVLLGKSRREGRR